MDRTIAMEGRYDELEDYNSPEKFQAHLHEVWSGEPDELAQVEKEFEANKGQFEPLGLAGNFNVSGYAYAEDDVHIILSVTPNMSAADIAIAAAHRWMELEGGSWESNWYWFVGLKISGNSLMFNME